MLSSVAWGSGSPAALMPPRPAVAHVLDQASIDQVLAAYRLRRPKAWEQFKPILEETLGQPITDTDAPLPMVELRLRSPA